MWVINNGEYKNHVVFNVSLVVLKIIKGQFPSILSDFYNLQYSSEQCHQISLRVIYAILHAHKPDNKSGGNRRFGTKTSLWK